MTLSETMEELKSYGNDQTKKTLLKHGAKEPFYGVKVGDLKKILKKGLRTKNSIRQIVSELESSLFSLFRASHLPYRAKSEKCSIFSFLFFHIFPIPPLWVLWATLPS